MNKYSASSRKKLDTCDITLQIILKEVLPDFDHTIIYGNRSQKLQMQLFQKGRAIKGDKWVIVNPLEVVTHCDGVIKKSNHNFTPSKAVDVIPYPLDWKDEKRMCFFAGHVMATARRLYKEGKIKRMIRWGGDWDSDTELKDQTFNDLAHFELI